MFWCRFKATKLVICFKMKKKNNFYTKEYTVISETNFSKFLNIKLFSKEFLSQTFPLTLRNKVITLKRENFKYRSKNGKFCNFLAG